ncbi:AAA family ATPase [Dactylosporangium sp. CA-139114]|uniref:AAA family ATPase n=1 Tax=Dactylosporangium sp. CA-139114 TaxID=3239931 RepID=UPI003D972836
MTSDRAELAVLMDLLGRTRQGGGGALVVRGAAGIGKTWLLEQALARVPQVRALRSTGVQFESELPFAGLHQLIAPLLDDVSRLPDGQRAALRVAFGIEGGAVAPDRFLVGMAVLTLLSQSAEADPLVCVVDDAQWLDRASAQALAFVARRVGEEGLALLFAVRDQMPSPDLEGLPAVAVGPLPGRQARELLGQVLRAPVDARVRERVLAEARGNPLAIVELARTAAPTQHAGGFAVPALSGHATEALYVERLATLPEATRTLLAVAAAEPLGDPGMLWRAAQHLGVAPNALDPAVTAGLISVDARVRFRHPLVRSAVHGAAEPAVRRMAHAALAAVTDTARDPDRQVWHRAQATVALDENVAGALVASAEQARARGGLAAAAAFLTRAAELTPDPSRRNVRTLQAAALTLRAGSPQQALDVLGAADPAGLTAREQATADLLRGEIAFALQRGVDAPALLRRAARRLETLDARAARDAYIDALHASLIVGFLGGDLRVVATDALARRRAERSAETADLLLDGMASMLLGQSADGAALLDRAVADRTDEVWARRPSLVAACLELWDLEAYREILQKVVRDARQIGALTALPQALGTLAGAFIPYGDLRTAEMLLDEGDRLAEAAGTAPLVYPRLHVLAVRGDADTADRLIDQVTADATVRGEGLLVAYASFTRALLRNGLADYAGARAAAREAVDRLDMVFVGLALRELVEAAVHLGDLDTAVDALAALRERTGRSGTAWARGIELGCAALVATGAAADEEYRAAIDSLTAAGTDCDTARMRLLYGQWLRREGRRMDARAELRRAHNAFVTMGAEGFAARTAAELLATGERAARHAGSSADQLTAQELRIARMVAEGMTTKETAAAVFLSPRTVDAHLRNIFRKLGIRSRRELRTVRLDGPSSHTG